MTKKEIEKLSDSIVNKLLVNFGLKDFDLETDGELDKESETLHQRILSEVIMNDSEYFITDEEMLIGELARLQTLLMIYEGEDTIEGYKKAAIILGKLRAIQHKLEKL
tara:strand:+ start:70 stop:393 length:324 start_codon:yes stop_codon:yes gene_type:complete